MLAESVYGGNGFCKRRRLVRRREKGIGAIFREKAPVSFIAVYQVQLYITGRCPAAVFIV
jgi:hypothetical protein